MVVSVQIIDLLLDHTNSFIFNDTSIGKCIATSGKEYLWSDRHGGERLDVIVVHYISAVAVSPDDPYNIGQILKIFCDFGVSSHFLVSRDGVVYRLVPEQMKAWHCGGSRMPPPDSRKSVNDFSIGIELMATADSGFTSEQYDSLAHLIVTIEKKYMRRFICVGHDMIAGQEAVDDGLRTDVKVDPGKKFEWLLLENRIIEYREQSLALL